MEKKAGLCDPLRVSLEAVPSPVSGPNVCSSFSRLCVYVVIA